jgi:hypothetical protein
MTQAFCVIHILVSGKSPEHRLLQHSDESMPAVLAGACVGEYIASKLEHQPAVEIEFENLGIRFTRRVRHDSLIRSRITC